MQSFPMKIDDNIFIDNLWLDIMWSKTIEIT